MHIIIENVVFAPLLPSLVLFHLWLDSINDTVQNQRGLAAAG